MPISNVCPRCGFNGLKRTCDGCGSRNVVRVGGSTSCGRCRMTSFCPCMDNVGERYFFEEKEVWAPPEEDDPRDDDLPM